MMNDNNLMLANAKRIPAEIRRMILEKEMITKAFNADVPGTPMEFLFDVYNEFVDPSGNVGNFNCPKCRQEVLNSFKKLHPYLIELNGK